MFGRLEDRLAVMRRLAFDGRAPAAYWCGQYADYVSHVQTDTRNGSHVSDTCTAALVELKYQHQHQHQQLEADQALETPVTVRFKAGKALNERKMALAVRTGAPPGSVGVGDGDGAAPGCGVQYDVQGAGTAITLLGECWAGRLPGGAGPVRLPRGWVVGACDPRIRANVESSAPPTPDSSDSPGRCTFAPGPGGDADSRPHGNAYIRVLAALLRDDRSMFVQTEELLLQWRLWDSVLAVTPRREGQRQADAAAAGALGPVIETYTTGANPWV